MQTKNIPNTPKNVLEKFQKKYRGEIKNKGVKDVKKMMVKIFSTAALIAVANFVINVFGSIQQAGACGWLGGEIEMPKSLIK